MAKLTKKRKTVITKFDATKIYNLRDAAKIVKDTTTTKFDSSVDVSIRLGIDVAKGQIVRGTVAMPHGIGKSVKVLVLCTADKEAEAKAAGAEHVGLDEYVEKIKGGWADIDVIICTPSVMGKVGALGKVLGPRGLMPNPKSGTVTMEIGKAVKEVKAGKIDFKADKQGIVHASIGKASFDSEKLADNANELIQTIVKLKPSASKGTYINSVTMSSTMGPGIKIDTRIFQ